VATFQYHVVFGISADRDLLPRLHYTGGGCEGCNPGHERLELLLLDFPVREEARPYVTILLKKRLGDIRLGLVQDSADRTLRHATKGVRETNTLVSTTTRCFLLPRGVVFPPHPSHRCFDILDCQRGVLKRLASDSHSGLEAFLRAQYREDELLRIDLACRRLHGERS